MISRTVGYHVWISVWISFQMPDIQKRPDIRSFPSFILLLLHRLDDCKIGAVKPKIYKEQG